MQENNKKIKVCFVIRVVARGGMEKVLGVIARGLQTTNLFAVTILVLTDNSYPEGVDSLRDLKIIFCNNRFFWGAKKLDRKSFNIGLIARDLTADIWQCIHNLHNYILHNQPDYLICLDCRSLIASIVARDFSLCKKLKIYGWFHFSIKQVYSKTHRWFITKWFINNKADAIIAICNTMKGEISTFCPKVPSTVIYNPITIENSDNHLILNSQEKIIFLYVGRVVNESKRLDRLFKALALLKNTNWELHIIGDGPDKNILVKLAQDLHIDPKITWHNWTQNPWNVLSRVTALVLSSDYEGFGLVLVEANYMGVPCISTDCPIGPHEIIENKKNGLLVPLSTNEEDNIKNYSIALNKVLENNRNLFTNDRTIHNMSIQKFGQAKIIRQWISILIPLRRYNCI